MFGFQFDRERHGDALRGEVCGERGVQFPAVAPDREPELDARRHTLSLRAHLADRLRGPQGFGQVRVRVRLKCSAHGTD